MKNDHFKIVQRPLKFLGCFSAWSLYKNHRVKMCLELVCCKCTLGLSHVKILEVNKRALFRYPWTQHLVCIILFSFRYSFTQYVDIRILNLTGYSTQMCYSVNNPPTPNPPILGVDRTDTNTPFEGNICPPRWSDSSLKVGSQHAKK